MGRGKISGTENQWFDISEQHIQMDRACYGRAFANPLDRYANYERSRLDLDRFHRDGITDFRHV